MTETYDRMDLRGLRPAGEPPPVSPLAAPARTLTPKRVTMAIQQWRDPATGELRSAEVESEAPDGAARTLMAQYAAALRSGVPSAVYGDVDNRRFEALARLKVQLRVPKGAEWIWDALQRDDYLLFLLEGAAALHERRWLRGDDGEGGGDAALPRLVVSALALDGTRRPDGPGGGGGEGA